MRVIPAALLLSHVSQTAVCDTWFISSGNFIRKETL